MWKGIRHWEVIYLDANATTPVDPEVLETMLPVLRDGFANPSTPYRAGREASRVLEKARGQVAEMLGAEASELVFTSGGTESDNAAVMSAWHGWPEKRHLIVGATEHSAVIEPARWWAEAGGEVSWLKVDSEGSVDVESLRELLRPGETALVSVMVANNETGVLAPIQAIAEIAHEAGALVHTDAAQAIGKVEDLAAVAGCVDYLALSGHKFHAPKGVGALYVSRRVRFLPSMLGGGQERGMRSGTENLSGIVGMGKAAELALVSIRGGSLEHMRELRDRLEARIVGEVSTAEVHGSRASRLPNTSSICFPGVEAAGMLILLDQEGVACTAGSACHSAAAHPSHVLEAMGFSAGHAASTLRFSLLRTTTIGEIDEAAARIVRVAHKMERLLDEASGPVAFG
jgi:cysteine desulfurase